MGREARAVRHGAGGAWEQATEAARGAIQLAAPARKQVAPRPQRRSSGIAASQHRSGGIAAIAITAALFLEVLERVVETAPSTSPPSETLPRALDQALVPLAHPCTPVPLTPHFSPLTLHQPSTPLRAPLGQRQAGMGEAEAAMRNEAGQRRLWQHRHAMPEVAECLLAPATASATSGPAIR